MWKPIQYNNKEKLKLKNTHDRITKPHKFQNKQHVVN